MHRPLILLLVLLGIIMPSNKFRGVEKAGAARSKLGSSDADRGADLVLLGGKIWTGEPAAKPARVGKSSAFATAVAISGGRFLEVGTDEQALRYAGRETKVLRLGGRLVAPGFIDSHAHFINGGFQLLELDLRNSKDEAEFTRKLAEKAKTLPPGRWILGGNWDEQAWPSAQLPTRRLIDAVTPKNPVFINRHDGHAALANSLALKLAGVTRETQQPVAGVIVRDPRSGEPTGILKDQAEDLVARLVPRPTEAEMQEALKAALAEAGRVGITSVHNITTDADSPGGTFASEIELLRRAEQEGWLTVRFYEITPIASWKRLAEAGVSQGVGSDFLKLGAVKGFADGSLGSGTAWMFEPFADEPGNRGLPMEIMNPPATMEALLRGAVEARIQPCIHAIGDRAVAEMLDLYTRVGGANAARYRLRIEHAQHVRSEDFQRFGKLGVIASMQPYHAIDDGGWAEKRLGRERSRTSYAWRSMLEAGAPLAFGSDWPVVPLDPLLGIYAAVTRATLDGKHPDGWFLEERLTVGEALRAYTAGGAFAAFEENQKGTIERGKLADLVVLSDDVFKLPAEKIQYTYVTMTVVGGRVVYQKK